MPVVKLLPIKRCGQCHYLIYSRLGNHGCSISNDKPVTNLNSIPTWCELTTTTQIDRTKK